MTIGRKQKIKTKKKARKRSRPSFKKGRLKFQKIRGKEIYDLVFKSGENTVQEVREKLDGVNFTGFNRGELPDSFVKITFVFAKSKKERAAISYIYQDLESTDELYDSITEMHNTITSKRDKTSKRYSKTYAQILRFKNYLSRIIVDFDTAT